jgi:hypothetical protein
MLSNGAVGLDILLMKMQGGDNKLLRHLRRRLMVHGTDNCTHVIDCPN